MVTPSTVIGQVGQATVTADRPDSGPVAIGLFLQGNDPNALIYWQSSGDSTGPPVGPAELLYRLGAESAWSTPRIRTVTSGVDPIPGVAYSPVFGDWFADPRGGVAAARPGLTIVSRPTSSTIEVDADLLRARNAAGIFVGDSTGANGLLFYFRPENRDVMWYQVRDGQWYGPLAAAPYRSFTKGSVASVQDVLRLTLGGLPSSLAIVAIFAVLGWLGSRRRYAALILGDATANGAAWSDGRGLPLPYPSLSRGRGDQSALPATWPAWLPDATASVISLAGLAASLYVATALLERMPHVQDSVAYLFQAETFALGRLWVPTPAHSQFFTHEFILMDAAGRWFSKYPPGWPMILALGQLAGAPWVVDPICGALSLILLYRLGKEIYRPRVGVLAAVLGLSAPFFLFLSGSFMSHTSGLLFTLLMTWAFWRASRSDRPALWSALAGVAFGMLFLIRPFSALPLAAPIAVYALTGGLRRPGQTILRYWPAVACALPFVAAFLAYNRVFTGSWFYPPQQLWWPFDQVGFGPDHGPWGFTPIDALNNSSRNLTELLAHGFGWPAFLTLAILPIPFLTGRARAWEWLFLAGLVGIVVGYALWWADGIMYGPRFYFEGFGFLVLLTARGFDVLMSAPVSSPLDREKPNTEPIAAVAAFVLLAGLIGYNLSFYLPGQLRLYHGYNYVSRLKLDAVAAAGIHHAVVFANVGKQYEWWEYGEVFSANDPLLQGDVIYARDLGDAEDRQLLLDFPGRAYYRLDGTTLTRLAD
jgi:hypothetical protein